MNNIMWIQEGKAQDLDLQPIEEGKVIAFIITFYYAWKFQMLDIIEDVLRFEGMRFMRIDGDMTNPLDRQARIDRFQSKLDSPCYYYRLEFPALLLL